MSKRRAKEKELLTLELGFADRAKLLKFPWPWADKSVGEFKCTDVFPYVPAAKRSAFMEEIYRILADSGKATILTNYWAGATAYADPRVEWPLICEQTYLFFNRKWREDQKVEYATKADFDFTYGYLLAPPHAGLPPPLP